MLASVGRILLVLLCWISLISVARAQPIVIAATGQSNDALIVSYAWSPDSRAQAWNNVLGFVGTGTAFAPLSTSTINVTWKIASEVARQNPGHDVRLITSAFGGQPIANWLSGYGGFPVVSPDIFSDLDANIAAALASIGATHVDYFQWSQGDADTANPNYASNFATLMTRLYARPWMPSSARILIHSIASSAVSGNAGGDAMNVTLQSLANADPANRSFVPSMTIPASPYWDAALPGHMTGIGYDVDGALAANVLADAGGQPWTPYIVKVSCGNGATASASPTGRFKLLPGKIVQFQITTGYSGGCGSFLKASVPFPVAPYFFGGWGYDTVTGSILSVALAGAYDANTVHVFSPTGGFPAGNPAVSGTYERQ